MTHLQRKGAFSLDAIEALAKSVDRRRLRLAKPFEVLLANDAPVSLVAESDDLPTRDQRLTYEFGMHCVDPRDGFARFEFLRPVRPGRRARPMTRRLFPPALGGWVTGRRTYNRLGFRRRATTTAAATITV